MAGGIGTVRMGGMGYLEGEAGASKGRVPSSERPSPRASSSERKRRGSLATSKQELQKALGKEVTNVELRTSSKDAPRRHSSPRTPDRDERADASCSPDASPEERPGLEWTAEPARVTKSDGSVVVRESVAAPAQGPRKHAIHLERTVRIEPRPDLRPASGRPPLPGKKVEQIVVTEAELKRCGGDLRLLLRECKVTPQSSPVREPEGGKGSSELELSFKSKFALKCKEPDSHMRDPWKNVENPEKKREMSELDRVGLNQPWIRPDTPPAKGISEALLASPPFGWSKETYREALRAAAAQAGDSSSAPMQARARSVDPAELLARHHRDPMGVSNHGRQGRRRSTSISSLTTLPRGDAGGDSERTFRETSPPEGGRLSTGGKWRSNSSSAGYERPLHREDRTSRRRSGSRNGMPNSPSPLQSSPSPPPEGKRPVVSRIQVLDDDDGPSLEGESGSLAVRLATRAQCSGIRVLTPGRLSGQSRVAWLALDVGTGEVAAYPGDAARRIEGAHRSGRRTVPLAGLADGGLEGAVVHFGNGKSDGCVEKYYDGRERLALRVEVGLLYNSGDIAAEAVVHVERVGNTWQFAPDGEVQAQERRVGLSPTELVTPPAVGDALPPVNPGVRTYFMNPGVMQ